MGIGELLLLCAATNTDALSIGLSCGFGGIKTSFAMRCLICLMSLIITGAGVLSGGALSRVLPEPAGKIIGPVMMMVLGIYILSGAVGKKQENDADKKNSERERCSERSGREITLLKSASILTDPQSCDADRSMNIDVKEACLMGLALSADSFAAGISAGVGGGLCFLMPIIGSVMQMIFLYTGEVLSGILKRRVRVQKSFFSLISGVIVLITAVLRFI